jgi:hypothetical protein
MREGGFWAEINSLDISKEKHEGLTGTCLGGKYPSEQHDFIL